MIKVGITIGDFNGIGPEIIIKSLSDKRIFDNFIPVIYGSSKVISFYKNLLQTEGFNYNKTNDLSDLHEGHIYIKNCWKEDVKITPGTPTNDSGKYAIEALKAAVEDIANNKLDILITAPIDKNNVQNNDFKFPGHTEFLANYAGVKNELMILTSDNLTTALVTGHIPVSEVSKQISIDKIVDKATIFHQSLMKDFGIIKPKIAVLGLNPHAGDNGVIGDDEKKTIIPAINKLRDSEILAFGPYSADGFFGSGNEKNFDGVLAMYHDQGLIPFKALSFGKGVNYTAGLPIVRTSPDHGTAFDIAGKNEANESSMLQAIYKSLDIFNNRKLYKDINSNPLRVKTKHDRS